MMICSETAPPPPLPPRLSFSRDVDDIPIQLNESRRDTMLLESSPSPCSDFEFNISSNSFGQESSSADELFANGMLLPVRIQEKQQSYRHKREIPALVSLPPRPKVILASTSVVEVEGSKKVDEEAKQPQSKSFWGFKRSSSLNYDIKKSLICNLSLLSRSNSTGSVPTPKRPSMNKHGSQSQKQPFISMTKSSSTSSSSSSSSSFCSNRPPLKKNHVHGVRVSPVLNVPPCISKGTSNLFGLGSLLRNGKNKKSKK